MADSLPNYDVSQQQLIAEIAALRANHARQKLEIMQMAERAAKHRENMDATLRAVAAKEAELQTLVDAHGPLDDKRYRHLCVGLNLEV